MVCYNNVVMSENQNPENTQPSPENANERALDILQRAFVRAKSLPGGDRTFPFPTIQDTTSAFRNSTYEGRRLRKYDSEYHLVTFHDGKRPPVICSGELDRALRLYVADHCSITQIEIGNTTEDPDRGFSFLLTKPIGMSAIRQASKSDKDTGLVDLVTTFYDLTHSSEALTWSGKDEDPVGRHVFDKSDPKYLETNLPVADYDALEYMMDPLNYGLSPSEKPYAAWTSIDRFTNAIDAFEQATFISFGPK